MNRLIALFLFVGAIGQALPYYNPSGPAILTDGVMCTPGPVNYCDPWQSMSFNVGFTGNYVREHKMLVKKYKKNDKVRNLAYRTDAGYLSLNICDYIEAYSAIGATTIDVEFPPQAVAKPDVSIRIPLHTETSYSLNVGGHAVAFQNGNFTLGIDAQYFWTKPRIVSVRNTEPNQINYRYAEWQFAAGGSYRIDVISCNGALIPYVGLRYNRSYFTADNITFIDKDGDTLKMISMRSLHHVGYTFGLTFVGCNKIQITGSANFISETSFLINSTFRF